MFEPVKCPKGCIWAMLMGNGPKGETIQHCGYILHPGNGARGCEPGPGCKRYQAGKKPGKTTIRVKKGGSRFRWDEPRGKKMWKDGKTDREIADALGVDRETIGKTRRRKWMKEP